MNNTIRRHYNVGLIYQTNRSSLCEYLGGEEINNNFTQVNEEINSSNSYATFLCIHSLEISNNASYILSTTQLSIKRED